MDDGLAWLGKAVERNLAVTVQGGPTRCEARLVRPARGPGGLWFQPMPQSRIPMQRLAMEGAAARVGFTMEGRRLEFETTLLKLDRHFWLNDQVMIEAVQAEAPAAVDQVENRRWPRVMVSDSADVRGTLYRLPRQHVESSRAPAALTMPGKLWDLSRGGASFVAAYERSVAEQFYARMPVCVGLEFRGTRMLLDGELRHAQATANGRSFRVGIGFDRVQLRELPPELDAMLGALEGRRGIVGYRFPAK